MKNIVILLLGVMVASSTAFAEAGPCANFAKWGAIRAYKAEVGTIQGSDGIQYSAKLIGTSGNISDYVVSILDNNEDGDTWTLDYSVQVKSSNNSCSVLAVKKIGSN